MPPKAGFSLKVFRVLSSVALDVNYPWKLAMRALKLAYFCIRQQVLRRMLIPVESFYH